MDDAIKQQYLKELVEELVSPDGARGIYPNAKWWRDIPSAPGVYTIYENSLLVYVGETADLRERMRDLTDTRHHTLRRSVGHSAFLKHPDFQKASSKSKFPPSIEAELDKHLLAFSVKAVPVSLGRKEVEEAIVRNKKPCFNKEQRRGAR